MEDHKNLWCAILIAISFLPASFSIDYFIMINMVEVRSLWKVKQVFLNLQTISTDNFNLVKYLGNTCDKFIFYWKMNSIKVIFENITHYISKILPTIFQSCYLVLTTLIFRNTSYWQFLRKWLVESCTFVKFFLFKINESLTKY